MARLSKKLKREWDFFISPKTGRRTYVNVNENLSQVLTNI